MMHVFTEPSLCCNLPSTSSFLMMYAGRVKLILTWGFRRCGSQSHKQLSIMAMLHLSQGNLQNNHCAFRRKSCSVVKGLHVINHWEVILSTSWLCVHQRRIKPVSKAKVLWIQNLLRQMGSLKAFSCQTTENKTHLPSHTVTGCVSSTLGVRLQVEGKLHNSSSHAQCDRVVSFCHAGTFGHDKATA